MSESGANRRSRVPQLLNQLPRVLGFVGLLQTPRPAPCPCWGAGSPSSGSRRARAPVVVGRGCARARPRVHVWRKHARQGGRAGTRSRAAAARAGADVLADVPSSTRAFSGFARPHEVALGSVESCDRALAHQHEHGAGKARPPWLCNGDWSSVHYLCSLLAD